MSHREEQPTEPTGLNPPWLPDNPGDSAYLEAEQPPDALMTLRVTPQVHIMVDPDYRLAITVKGGSAVVNASVLMDALTTAERYRLDRQPVPGGGAPKGEQ